MQYVRGIFEEVINGLNDVCFGQDDVVIEGDQFVVDVECEWCKEVDGLVKKGMEEFLGDIGFMWKEVGIERFREQMEQGWMFVGKVWRSEKKRNYVRCMIRREMQVEGMRGWDCWVWVCGNGFEEFVGIRGEIVGYWYDG